MIFYKWENVHNEKEQLYVLVDENFNGDSNVFTFKDFTIDKTFVEHPKDFFDNSSPNLFIYLRFENQNSIPKIQNCTYIFKKNKLYKFGRKWYDEIGNLIDDYHDIWYDPFLFVYEKDYDQAIRALKLKQLEK